jgi:hypothetical protein
MIQSQSAQRLAGDAEDAKGRLLFSVFSPRPLHSLRVLCVNRISFGAF